MDSDQRKRLVRRLGEALQSRHLAFALRVIVGVTLLVSGLAKMPNMAGFAKDVVAYAILPDSVAHLYGLSLPWLEVLLGALLLVGLLTRWVAAAGLLVVMSFTVVNAMAIGRWKYMIYGECGCFGSLVSLSSWEALVIDIAMAVCLILIVLHRGEFLSLDGLLRRRKTRSAATDRPGS